MKILAIVGTQLRHQYYLSIISKYFNISGIIYYERSVAQKTTNHLQIIEPADLELEQKHFQHLIKKEKEYFLEVVKKFDHTSTPNVKVSSTKELNSKKIIDWVESKKLDVIIDYGSGILGSNFLKISPLWIINLHGGLSPYFKGSATLFWPFYFQQPELAGITYHLIDSKIDHGDIIQHFRPTIFKKDTIHDIGCRAIKDGSLIAVRLLKKLEKNGYLETFPQMKNGKLFLEKDYKAGHIKIVYDLWEKGIIDNYLKNKESIDKQYSFIDQLKGNNYGIG